MAPEGEGEAVVELGAGEQRSGIEITLEPRAVVKGRIVDPEHNPLLGWIVALRDPGVSADGQAEGSGTPVRVASSRADQARAVR